MRFLSQPSIRNKYVYITYIDMFVLTDNFYLYLIEDVFKRKSCYSNIAKKNKKLLLILNFMKSKRIKIDYETFFRQYLEFMLHKIDQQLKLLKLLGGVMKIINSNE